MKLKNIFLLILSLGIGHTALANQATQYSMFTSSGNHPEDQDVLITARTKDMFSFKKCQAFQSSGAPTDISEIRKLRLSSPQIFKDVAASQAMMAKYFASPNCKLIGKTAYGYTGEKFSKYISHGSKNAADIQSDSENFAGLSAVAAFLHYLKNPIDSYALKPGDLDNYNFGGKMKLRLSNYAILRKRHITHALMFLTAALAATAYEYGFGDESKASYITRSEAKKNKDVCDIVVASDLSDYPKTISHTLIFDVSSSSSECKISSMKSFIEGVSDGLKLGVEQGVFVPL